MGRIARPGDLGLPAEVESVARRAASQRRIGRKTQVCPGGTMLKPRDPNGEKRTQYRKPGDSGDSVLRRAPSTPPGVARPTFLEEAAMANALPV